MPSRAVAGVVVSVARALDRVKLSPGGMIVAAVSGGPDSVALLRVLASIQSRARFRLTAAHFNHRLRGAESDRDEEFVRRLCAELEIEFVSERAGRCHASMPNLEERSRELRLAFLNRAADRFGASLIALAHHSDDQAETVLMRLLRGAGAAGLGAMAERGPGRFWRPLLRVTRASIALYLDKICAGSINDSSNASPLILRNRIRRELIPRLERDFAPGLSGRLVELAAEMRALDEFVTAAARAELAQRRDHEWLRLDAFADLAPALAAAVLREFICERRGSLRRISRDQVDSMRRLCTGANASGRVVLAGGWRLRRDYAFARLDRVETAPVPRSAPVVIDLEGLNLAQFATEGFKLEARRFTLADSESVPLPPDASQALFDAAELGPALLVRSIRPGDRLVLPGMDGRHKVQDLFVDRKIPRELRPAWPLVLSGETIVWIPGVARSRIALIGPGTREILHLRGHFLMPTELATLLKNPMPC
jgi:tRNA(Ile)-lysidine synthase